VDIEWFQKTKIIKGKLAGFIPLVCRGRASAHIFPGFFWGAYLDLRYGHGFFVAILQYSGVVAIYKQIPKQVRDGC
jgi:hypothetical protein